MTTPADLVAECLTGGVRRLLGGAHSLTSSRAVVVCADEQWVLCAVQDNGVGLEPHDQERVFEQFYRVQHPDIKNEQGTGLGLTVTRSIVELHKGHIWVDSEPGRGSTFYFTLPAE